MNWREVSVGAAVWLCLMCSVAPGQAPGLPAEPPTSQMAAKPPDENTPRELVYPYYSLREGAQSVLSMMDRAPRPVEFTVAIHSQSGRTVVSQPKTIQPAEEVDIDVKQLLNDLNMDWHGEFIEGTLSILFTGKGNPLGGRMSVEGPREKWNIGPVWTSGEYGQNMFPAKLDTLWWDLGGTRDLTLRVSNITPKALQDDLRCNSPGSNTIWPCWSLALTS